MCFMQLYNLVEKFFSLVGSEANGAHVVNALSMFIEIIISEV